MNVEAYMNPDLSLRLCLTLMHSLWQVPLLAVMAWVVDRILFRPSVIRSYSLNSAALIGGLLLLPVSFMMMSVLQSSISNSPLTTLSERSDLEDNSVSKQARFDTSLTSVSSASSTDSGMPNAIDDIRATASSSSSTTSATVTSKVLENWRTLGTWGIAIYSLGVFLMLVRLGLAATREKRLRLSSMSINDGAVQAVLEKLCQRLSLASVPAVRFVQKSFVPHVTGLMRPVILLPASAIFGLSRDELSLLLAHELAHIRRKDMWVLLMQRIAETVMFFNPSIWFLSRRVSLLREHCCDDLAIQASKDMGHESPVRYANALLKLAELCLGNADQNPALTTLAAVSRTPSELRCRIARLLGEPGECPVPISLTALLSAFAATILLFVSTVPPLRSLAQSTENSVNAEAQLGPEQADIGDNKSDTNKDKKPSVRVVAIGTHDETMQRWWNPDGTILESVPFEWSHTPNLSAPAKYWRRIVIEVKDIPTDSELRWDLNGPSGWSSGDAKATVELPESSRFLGKWFAIPEGTETFTSRIGIPTGSWKTVATAEPNSPSAMGSEKGSFVFSRGIDTNGAATITVSHNVFDEKFRIVAIDKAGSLHDSGDRGGVSAGKIYQASAAFKDLPISQVDRFEFQVRPYEWIENADLPVHPDGSEKNTATKQDDVQRIAIIVAKHVLLVNGNEIVTWKELDQRFAAMPDPSYANPAFYITRGATEAGQDDINQQIKSLHTKHQWRSQSQGSLWGRSDFRYDSIRSPDDLQPNADLLVAGSVVNSEGQPVSGAQVILITPIDESVGYLTYHMELLRGRVRNALDHVLAISDSSGRFEIYPPKGSRYWIVAMHPEQGFATVRDSGSNPDDISITLHRWAELTIGVEDVPGEKQSVDLSGRLESTNGLPEVVFNLYWSDLNKMPGSSGRSFQHSHVPPHINMNLNRSFKGDQGTSHSIPGATVRLLPDEESQINLGPFSKQQKALLDFIRK